MIATDQSFHWVWQRGKITPLGMYIIHNIYIAGLIISVEQCMGSCLLVFFVFAHTYSSVKLRQFLLNSLTYLAVHKPKFA